MVETKPIYKLGKETIIMYAPQEKNSLLGCKIM